MSANPFAQPAKQSQLSFACNMNAAMQAELFFEDIARSVSCYEVDEAKAVWGVDVLMDEELAPGDAEQRLKLFALHFKIAVPAFQVSRITPEDWQNNLHQFPPITIGRWYIHGSHITDAPPVSSLPLCIDAGLAFGSGEHATTSGCLTLLQHYLQHNTQQNMHEIRLLDMGTGSGILAMGAATLLRNVRALAVEIDPVAARVAEENVRINKLTPQVRVIAADGYANAAVQQEAPYNVIVANILARPLMKMAKNLNAALAPGGVAILSGLLNSQERMVISAHRLQGLRLSNVWRNSGWSAIMMKKPGNT